MWIENIVNELTSERALLFTANQRLQRFIYRKLMQNQSYRPSLPIHTLDQWVEEEWNRLADRGEPTAKATLLSQYAQRKIWQQLVDQFPPEQALYNATQLADLLAEAYNTSALWQVPPAQLTELGSEETRYFVALSRRFDQFLEERELITVAGALEIISQTKHVQLEAIYTYGFQEISPFYLKALNDIADRVVELPQLQQSDLPPAVSVSEYQEKAQEYASVAEQCKNLLTENPEYTIAVVVPNLEQDKQDLEEIFTREFSPQNYLLSSCTTPAPLPFEISAAKPLILEPVISDAFLLLQLDQTTLERETAIALTQSIFWGSDQSQTERDNLHNTIYCSDSAKFSVADLVKEHEGKACADILLKAQQFFRDCIRSNKHFNCTEAASLILKQLEIFGWPGNIVLSSREYQAVNQFIDLLKTFSSLDVVRDSYENWPQMIAQLREICTNKIFHIEQKFQPIQILGIMEASGSTFDKIFVVNCHNQNIPAKPTPNPFIPFSIQVQYDTPRSTANRELLFARKQIQGLTQAASQIVFSYALKDEEKALEISPLLENFSIQSQHDASPENKLDKKYRDALKFDAFDVIDTSIAPIIPPGNYIPGGAGYIRLHAADPLRAYLVYQLGVKAPYESYLGFTPADRGNMLHEVLAKLWSKISSLDALLSYDDVQLKAWIEDITEQVIRAQLSHSRREVDYQLKQLERKRLGNLVYDWLQTEKQRPTFTVIAEEKQVEFSIEERKLKMRIDRIDQTQDKQILIDYKTKSVSLSKLLNAPVLEPQLPLYTLYLTQIGDTPAAAMFGTINSQKISMEGIADEDFIFGDLVTPNKVRNGEFKGDWAELVEWWTTQIQTQVRQLVSGDVTTRNNNAQMLSFYQYLSPAIRDTQ